MRTRLTPLFAALTVVFIVLAAAPARAEGPVPPKKFNPRRDGRTLQVLRPVPQVVAAPGATYTFDDTPASSIAIDRRTGCRSESIERTFSVPQGFAVYDVDLGFNANHQYRGDIQVTLESPQGPQVVLISASTDNPELNYDLMLDDSSTRLIDDYNADDTTEPYFDRTAQPSYPLGAFNGQPSNGNWILRICDTDPNSDDGFYNRARLVLQSPPTSAALEASKTADKHVVAAGMTINCTITIHNGGQTGASGVILTDPIPGGAAYVAGSVQTIGGVDASFNGTAIVWAGDVGALSSVIISYSVTVTGDTEEITNTSTVEHSSLAEPLRPSVQSDVFRGQDYLYPGETPLAIPDNSCPTTVAASIVVDRTFPVVDVQVGLNVTHGFRGDLSAKLRSPQGTLVSLFAPDNLSVRDNFDIRLDSLSTNPLDNDYPDDTAFPFYERTVGATALIAFANENPQGTWTLEICEASALEEGTLNHWSLFFYTRQVPAAPVVRITPAVLLSWDAVTDIHGKTIQIQEYQIWRGGTPDFETSPTPAWTVPRTETSYPDGSAPSDPAYSYYYVIRALSAGGVPSDYANRTAKFTFGLTKVQ